MLPPESTFDARPEYCEDCFSSPGVLHWHNRFLLVDQEGEHVAVERLCGLAELRYITLDDLPVQSGLDDDQACGICCMEFSSEEPATCGVGCTSGHGEGLADPRQGMLDSKTFYHAECRMSWIKSQKTDTYCGDKAPVHCKVCLFENDCKAWMKDFQRGIDAIKAYGEREEASLEELLNFLTQEFQIEAWICFRSFAFLSITLLLYSTILLLCLSFGVVENCMMVFVGFCCRFLHLIQQNPKELPKDIAKKELPEQFRRALKELHPQPWLQSLIDRL